MYLHAKQYVKNWDFKKPEEHTTITYQKGDGPVEVIEVKELVYEVGYWRKANHIHAWFVQNCNDGVDNNGSMYVEREKLEELLKTCETVLGASELAHDPEAQIGTQPDGLPIYNPDVIRVLKDSTVAEELLPTQGGFFFGDTAYTQYYLSDIKDTIEILTKALALEGVEYEYMASW